MLPTLEPRAGEFRRRPVHGRELGNFFPMSVWLDVTGHTEFFLGVVFGVVSEMRIFIVRIHAGFAGLYDSHRPASISKNPLRRVFSFPLLIGETT